MAGGNRSGIFEGLSDDVIVDDPDFAKTWEGMEEPMGDDWPVVKIPNKRCRLTNG